MREPTRIVSCLLLVALFVAPTAALAGPDRDGRLQVRGAKAPVEGSGGSWGVHARFQGRLARVLGLLPFSVPAMPDDEDGIFSSLGLSDDPDPTGNRPDDPEDDDEQTSGPAGDQDSVGNDNDDGVFQIGGR